MTHFNLARVAVIAASAAQALLLGALASPAMGSGSPSYSTGELVVKYEQGTTQAERTAVRDRAGIRSAGRISDSSQLVELGGEEGTLSKAGELESDPRVAYARPN